MNEHNEMKQLISSYLDGECSAQERVTVENHIRECKACCKYYEEMKKLSSKLAAWKNEELSPDLEQKLNKEVLFQKSREGQKMKPKNSIFKVGIGGGAVATIIVALFVGHIYTKNTVKTRFQNTFGDVSGLVSDSKLIPMDGQNPTGTKVKVALDQSIVKKEKNEYLHDKLDYKKRTVTPTVSIREESVRYRDAGGYQANLQPELAKVAGSMKMVAGKEMMIYPPRHPMPYPPHDPDLPGRYNQDFHTEQYDRIYENEFMSVNENPLSTFSIDVDTASYSNIRRFLNSNQMPPEDSVRIEEMINYFTYDYPYPQNDEPFSITTKASTCPWNDEHKLMLVGLQGKTLQEKEIPPSNLVFLIDVSGSMRGQNKLPLLKQSFKLLVNQLRDDEKVAIVVYAGAAGQVLESTPGSNKQKILDAIDNLYAGGSTAGGAGIKLAYKIAKENFIKDGNNRVILATDGDFNVGVSSNGELVRLIEDKRKDNIFLTILGFGTGNYKDNKMEQIANKGNGNYYYIDTLNEARKVLVSELGSTLFTIAKDVKIQIEFNPSQIKAYRLIGYENRILAKEDFNDDTKDAGELGAGHTVTALYEIVLNDSKEEFRKVDDLEFQKKQTVQSDDLMIVKLRYKKPDEETSKLIKKKIQKQEIKNKPTDDFQFVSAVAEFGLLLRNSKYKGNSSYQSVIKNATESKGNDKYGYREEFINLVKAAQNLDTRSNQSGINFKSK